MDEAEHANAYREGYEEARMDFALDEVQHEKVVFWQGYLDFCKERLAKLEQGE